MFSQLLFLFYFSTIQYSMFNNNKGGLWKNPGEAISARIRFYTLACNKKCYDNNLTLLGVGITTAKWCAEQRQG